MSPKNYWKMEFSKIKAIQQNTSWYSTQMMFTLHFSVYHGSSKISSSNSMKDSCSKNKVNFFMSWSNIWTQLSLWIMKFLILKKNQSIKKQSINSILRQTTSIYNLIKCLIVIEVMVINMMMSVCKLRKKQNKMCVNSRLKSMIIHSIVKLI